MTPRLVRTILWLVLSASGVVAGVVGGAMAYRRLHPPLRLRPELDGPPAGLSMVPPELLPEPAHPQDRAEPAPPEEFAAAPAPPAGPEFFGFPVDSLDRAPEQAPKTATEPPAPHDAAPAPPAMMRLRLMEGRCVGGFDGTCTLFDFSGWTRAVVGELTFETGRLVETARGRVTADPASLDTGDAGRDREIRENLLELERYPRMSFDLSALRMTGVDTVDVSGTMEIHGIRRDVTIPCSIRLRRDGYVWVKGEIKANMSDFGIEPPVKLAIIKVADEIRIWFEVWAEPVKEPPK